MKDTSPEVNAMLFRLMMERTPAERFMMGMDMMTTARAMVMASLPPELDEKARRVAFYERFYGESCPPGVREHRADGVVVQALRLQ